MPKLVCKHKKLGFDNFSKCQVFVDGNPLFRLGANGFDFKELEAKKHDVYVKRFWLASPLVEFDLSDGEDVLATIKAKQFGMSDNLKFIIFIITVLVTAYHTFFADEFPMYISFAILGAFSLILINEIIKITVFSKKYFNIKFENIDKSKIKV